MTDDPQNDATAVSPAPQAEAEAPVADHPEAGVAPGGWSTPQADLATPGTQFAKLIVKRSGAETDVVFPINPPAIIGRFDPTVGPIDVDLQAMPEGVYVSRKHAKITFEDGVWRVVDLGSSNGTYILRDEFERVDEAELADGTEFALGNARFVFRVTVEDSSAPSA